jgi:hypothetical protein
MGPVLEHDYLRLSLPPGWEAAEAPGELFARYTWPNGAEISVLLAQLPPPKDAEEIAGMLVQAHNGNVRAGSTALEADEPVTRRYPGIVEVRRTHRVQYGARRLGVITRYAVSELPVAFRGGPLVHAAVRVSAYGPADSDLEGLAGLVDAAVMVPMLATMQPFADTASSVLFPYLLAPEAAAQRDRALASVGRPPEGFGSLPRLANGLHLTIAEETPENVRPLFPVDLEDKGLTLADGLATAAANVAARLGTEELPVRVVRTTPYAVPAIWQEGIHPVVRGTDTTALFVVGPSWMAGSAAATGALYTQAAQALGSPHLMVLAPHRDLLFVFVDQGEAANRLLADGIARAEADGRKPLSPVPVRLLPHGVEAYAVS